MQLFQINYVSLPKTFQISKKALAWKNSDSARGFSLQPTRWKLRKEGLVKFDDFFDFRSSYWVTTEFLLSDFWNFMVEKIQKVLLLERPVILIRPNERHTQLFSMTNRSPERTGERNISFWRERVSSDSLMENLSFPYFIGIFASFLGKKYYWVILFEIPPLQV